MDVSLSLSLSVLVFLVEIVSFDPYCHSIGRNQVAVTKTKIQNYIRCLNVVQNKWKH
jgi:hypothetical protein